MRAALLATAAVFALATAGHAQMPLTGAGSGGLYRGPGDVGVAASVFFGLRAYSLAVALAHAKAVNLRRASDSTTLDITLLSNGDLDVAAAGTFCNATSCTAAKLYDQLISALCTGSCDLLQATANAQPAFVFNCLAARPCLQLGSAAKTLVSAGNFTPSTGVLTLAAVAIRVSGTGACAFMRTNGAGNRLAGAAVSANQWSLTASGVSLVAAAADNAWHAGVGVITNSAASLLAIDGVNTPGTLTGGPAAGLMSNIGNNLASCNFGEASAYDNVAASTAHVAALTTNMRNYWGI